MDALRGGVEKSIASTPTRRNDDGRVSSPTDAKKIVRSLHTDMGVMWHQYDETTITRE
jgi:hypothetical protein